MSDEIKQEAIHAFQEHISGNTIIDAEAVIESVIQAVLPHIRNEILEEAARVCNGYVFAEIAASKIRNLKDKTDEAHNG